MRDYPYWTSSINRHSLTNILHDIAEAEDAMMGRHKLLTVTWRQYTAPKERHLEADETDAEVRMSPGWKFVDEIKQVFEKIRAIENDLGAPELHGGDYEEFSKQEDKIKVRVNSRASLLHKKSFFLLNHLKHMEPKTRTCYNNLLSE